MLYHYGPHSPGEQNNADDKTHHPKRVTGTEETVVVEQGGYLLLGPFPCRWGKPEHGCGDCRESVK